MLTAFFMSIEAMLHSHGYRRTLICIHSNVILSGYSPLMGSDRGESSMFRSNRRGPAAGGG